MKQKIISITIIVLFTLLLSLALAVGGLGYIIPPPEVREIARWYLERAYYPYDRLFTVMSPEVVTSIVWDFRGLDTLFETMVFYLAIIGSVALLRGIKTPKPSRAIESYGLSLIVKSVTKITLGLILAVAASIALHGHLTPGGGFQGGATAAVVSLLVLVVFSIYYMEKRGVSKNNMLALRSIGLIGVGLTAIIVFIIGLLTANNAFVFQNQPKEVAPIGLPAYIGGALISGTLWFFNVFEMLAVAAGFTIVFLLLTLPERVVMESIRGDDE